MPCDLYLCSALYALAGMNFFSIMGFAPFSKYKHCRTFCSLEYFPLSLDTLSKKRRVASLSGLRLCVLSHEFRALKTHSNSILEQSLDYGDIEI